MKSWYEIYQGRMNKAYRRHVANKYFGFIDIINNQIRNYYYDGPLVIGEFGCGAANISRIVAEKQSKNNTYVLIDNCHKMLSLAMENMQGEDALFYNKSILDEDLPMAITFGTQDMSAPIDIIHSHGVLEHFSNEEINQILAVQKELCTGPLIHYVPSAKYEVPSRGDERLLTPAQWKEICNPDNIHELNNGFDLVLTFNER